jgi:hypothetical protein
MTPPALTLQVQGQTISSADVLNTGVQWCQNAGQLRAFIGIPTMQVYLQGLVTPSDGGQGNFIWLATVSQSDDGRNYIIPLGANGGGWVRIGPALALPIPSITGALTSVADANAKAVLTSIISALVTLGLVTKATT